MSHYLSITALPEAFHSVFLDFRIQLIRKNGSDCPVFIRRPRPFIWDTTWEMCPGPVFPDLRIRLIRKNGSDRAALIRRPRPFIWDTTWKKCPGPFWGPPPWGGSGGSGGGQAWLVRPHWTYAHVPSRLFNKSYQVNPRPSLREVKRVEWPLDLIWKSAFSFFIQWVSDIFKISN